MIGISRILFILECLIKQLYKFLIIFYLQFSTFCVIMSLNIQYKGGDILKRQILILLLIGTVAFESYNIYDLKQQNTDQTVKIEKLNTQNIALSKTLEATQEYATTESNLADEYKSKLYVQEDDLLGLIDTLDGYSKQDYLEAYKVIIKDYGVPKKGIYDVTTDSEFKFICQIVQAEIGGGTFEQKVNVATVIINRYKSNLFPSTWNDILKQEGQFSSYWDGRYKTVKVTDDTIQAIEYAYYFGSDQITDSTYFCADTEMSEWHTKNLIKVYDDGKHTFFKEIQ